MKRAWWAFGLALGAGIIWLAGLVALGIWNEDVCMVEADAVPWASGYTQSVRVWPPALVCEYLGVDATETVAHTIRGVAVFGWTYVAPLVIAVGLLVWAVTASEMSTLTRADRTADGR